jgi:hypothetical protein
MIIWLASYPKSGNTWVRSFLTAYFADAPVNINRLKVPVASSRAVLDKHLARSTADLPPNQVEALRPAAYRQLAAAAARRGSPAFVKVHDVFKRTQRNEPLFPADVTHGAVYIARNPLDVAVSFAHHLGFTVERTTDVLSNERFFLCLNDATKKQVPQLLRSWRSHVASWLDQHEIPVHLVKYEDLHASPVPTFGGMLTALGFDVDPARLERAIEAVTLAKLQAQELLHGFNEKAAGSTAPFFRQGKVGAWSTELTAAGADRIKAYNGDMMRRLGYL